METHPQQSSQKHASDAGKLDFEQKVDLVDDSLAEKLKNI